MYILNALCVYVHIHLQEPQTVLLGTERQWIGSGEKRSYVEVRDEMIYVPILETIQSLLNNGNVSKQVCTCDCSIRVHLVVVSFGL